MADETLAFDILARDRASSAFDKVARSADKTAASLKKSIAINDAVEKSELRLSKARDNESDALGRVRVAETRLAEIRGNANAKASQIQKAEEDLSTARRKAAQASNTAVMAEDSLAKARAKLAANAETVGKESGHSFGKGFGDGVDKEGAKTGKRFGASLKRWLTGSGGAGDAGRAGGTVFGSGFLGVLKTPILGPAVVAAITAGVAVAMPAVGAIAASGLVAGFGAGLVVLGSVFAAKSVAVKNAWNRSLWAMAADMKILSKPFERTLIDMAAFARRTFVKLTPALSDAFKGLAPAMSKFGDDLGRAFEKLAPAIRPVSVAFAAVLKSLGPAMQSAMGSFAHGLQTISDSVARNPDGLSDLVRGTGKLFDAISGGLSMLNDLNSAFKVLPGGASAVTRVMNTLTFTIKAALGPLALLEVALRSVNALSHSMEIKPEGFAAASQAANQTVKNLQAVRDAAGGAGAGLDKQAGAAGRSAHETHAANVAAYLLATAFDRQAAATQRSIDALNRRSNLLLSLSGAEIDYQQAVDDATQAIKDNGKTHDINTQKGRDNKRALDQVAASAVAQRDAMLKANDGNVKAAASAAAGRASFVKLAQQMGYTKPQAEAMAKSLIAIPNVTRTARLTANKKDLETKLAQAETALKNPNLSATKKAKLTAEISNLKAGIAEAQSKLSGLPVSKTAKLLANKRDLEAKLAAAQTALKNPALTATKTAILKAKIAALQAGIAAAQGLLNNLPGSKTVTITTRLVTERISRTVSGASGGHVPTEKRAGGGPVTAGTPYLVGEKGPEIVVPNASGVVIPNDALNAGKGIVTGLTSGLRGGASQAMSAAGDLASSILAKAREVLGIASPSKAFAKLGLWVNQGFAIGLKGSAKQVQSVMASLMSKVLDISYNAADTKKAIQKTITSLNTQIAKARGRLKPITRGMSKSEVASAERNNRQVNASIRSLQARLKSAKTDLANVNSIANRLGTTKKRNAIIGMLQRENAAMQKLANARAVVASQLKVAQDRLAAAVQVRDEFKKSITDAAMAFNSITSISTDEGRTLVSQDILSHMQNTLAKTKQFANQLASLKNLGIRSDLYKQIAEAGVEAGGATAAALLQGGKSAVASANSLQAQIAAASAGLGNTAAKNMYQAGVDAAQGLVNGLLAKTKALDAASKKLAAAIVAQIKKTLGIRSPSKVLEWHGSMAGQGFAAGILGEYGRVQKAGAGLGAAAVPGRPSTARGSGSEVRVVFELRTDGSPHMEWLAREFRKYVRATAGGNVQQALGAG